jgi:hypothetical protein
MLAKETVLTFVDTRVEPILYPYSEQQNSLLPIS